MPKSPQNIRLFGATEDERQSNRGPNSVRIAFDTVAEADSFKALVNETRLIDPFASGDTIHDLLPNNVVALKVWAVQEGEPDSEPTLWRTVTRPPKPARPTLQEGVEGEAFLTLTWDIPADFPGAAEANVELFDEISTKKVGHFQRKDRTTVPVVGSNLAYTLYLLVPGNNFPADVLNGQPNVSFPSDKLELDLPPSRRRISVSSTETYVAFARHQEINLIGRLSFD